MDASTRFDTEVVGALPVIASILKNLRFGEIIDQLVPWEGEVALGTLAEIWICTRLLNPTAMFRIGEWAEKAGVTTYYKVSREELNDDRLGRALERLAQHQRTIQAALVAQAIKRYQLRVDRINYDISNVELY